MSHPTDWTCRSCRTPLGQVRDGVLRPLAPVEQIDPGGVARVPCPNCGRVQVWRPASAGPTVATNSDSNPPGRNGAGRDAPYGTA